MSSFRNAFLLTLLSVFFVYSHATTTFSFYVFACEWAGSVCKENSCGDDKGASTNFWNVHGLWPSDGSEDLNYCTDEKFDPTQITKLQDQLTQFWNGLYSSADAFHEHEWTKHGTCANMKQEKFFSTVLELAQKLDVYSALEKNGIVPGKTYSCSDFERAIKQEYGIESFSIASNDGYIGEIDMCVGTDLHPKDCPMKSKICSGQVHYPDFTDMRKPLLVQS